MSRSRLIYSALVVAAISVSPLRAQEPDQTNPADRAFEAREWALAIDEYRRLTQAEPENGTSWLRIAQAQRELGRNALALETLQTARERAAPEAMVELERARNLSVLGQPDSALRALEAADHLGSRALEVFEAAREFDALRSRDTFQRVYRSVRRRVFPCEGSASTREFDFWIGTWYVRLADGTLVGRNTITKRDGGCTIHEAWEGNGGMTGTSVSYYQPSREQWRQLWMGSNGTLIDISGGLNDGAMHLEGTIEYVGQNRIEAFRGTWAALPDGGIRQHFEEFNLVAQAWQTWFDGYYRLATVP
jgi:tetratricopeptide (TPR) repeat protein